MQHSGADDRLLMSATDKKHHTAQAPTCTRAVRSALPLKVLLGREVVAHLAPSSGVIASAFAIAAASPGLLARLPDRIVLRWLLSGFGLSL